MTGKDIQIDWEKFSKKVKKLIEYQSKNTLVPIRAESWEELLYVVFQDMGHVVNWNPSDHTKGVDLVLNPEDIPISISAKAGKVNILTNEISISSYGLTRYKTLKDKLDFLKENARGLDIYITLPKTELKDKIIYWVVTLDPNKLVPKEMLDVSNWEENDKRWTFRPVKVKGLKASIVKSMSNQLWYSISLDFKHINKLVEVEVSREDIGKNLYTIL